MSPKRIIIDDDLYDLLDQEATARSIPLTIVASEHLHAAVGHYAPARSAGERRKVSHREAEVACQRPRCSFPTCGCVTVIGDLEPSHKPGCSCSLCYWGTMGTVWSDEGMSDELPSARAAGELDDPRSIAALSMKSARGALASAMRGSQEASRVVYNESYFAPERGDA